MARSGKWFSKVKLCLACAMGDSNNGSDKRTRRERRNTRRKLSHGGGNSFISLFKEPPSSIEEILEDAEREQVLTYRPPSPFDQPKKASIVLPRAGSTQASTPGYVSPSYASPRAIAPSINSPKATSPRAGLKVYIPRAGSPRAISSDEGSPRPVSPKAGSPKVPCTSAFSSKAYSQRAVSLIRMYPQSRAHQGLLPPAQVSQKPSLSR